MFELLCKATSDGSEWVVARDLAFNDSGARLAGRRASAALAAIAGRYPYLIESKPHGTLVARKLKVDMIGPFKDELPMDYLDIIYKYNLYRPYAPDQTTG